MTAAEAVAQYRKSAGALRRMRAWAGSPPRTIAASIAHQKRMTEALAYLRGEQLQEVERRLCEERRLLDSAYGSEEYDPEESARARSRAKQHQYRVKQLIRNHH